MSGDPLNAAHAELDELFERTQAGRMKNLGI